MARRKTGFFKRDPSSCCFCHSYELGVKPNDLREQLVGLMGSEPDPSEQVQEVVAVQGADVEPGWTYAAEPKKGVGLSNETVAMLGKAVDLAAGDGSGQVLLWHVLLALTEESDVVTIFKESSEEFYVDVLRRKIERRLNTA